MRKIALAQTQVRAYCPLNRLSPFGADGSRQPKDTRFLCDIDQRAIKLRQMIQTVSAIQKNLVHAVAGSRRFLCSDNNIDAMLLRVEEGVLTRKDDRRVARWILLVDL